MSAAGANDHSQSQSLAQLQRHFIAHLRGTTDEHLEQAVDVGRLPATTGLRIYAHAYGARLREALENDHPVLGAYLVDALWESLKGYIDAHPSRVRSLRDFGNALPAFLAETEQFRGHPQLAELARFERLLLDSFDAADDPRAEWAQLQAIPPEQWPAMCVRLHRSVRDMQAWRSGRRSRPTKTHLHMQASKTPSIGCCGATKTASAVSIRWSTTAQPHSVAAGTTAASPDCAN